MRLVLRTALRGVTPLLLAVAAGCALAPAPAGPSGPVADILAECRLPDYGQRQECYEKALLAHQQAVGVEAAIRMLDTLAAHQPEVKREGHVYAHAIGISAYTTPEEVGKTFAACTPGYQSGCYHGVVQAYFADVQWRSPQGLTAETVNALCGDHRGKEGSPWLLFQCSHGIGHGLVIYHGAHLPRALGSCDLVREAPEREACYGGAFMENIMRATHPQHSVPSQAHGDGHGDGHGHGAHAHHGAGADTSGESFRPLDPDDLLYPCSVVAERYWAGCYSIQTAAILHHTQRDVARAARACDQAPETMRPVCHASLGRDISGMALRDHREAVRMCSLVGAAAEPACHVGVVQDLVNFAARAEDGVAYCRVVPGEESKKACYRAVGGQLAALRYEAGRQEAVCGRAEEGYVEVCRRGAGLPWREPSPAPAQRTGSQ